MAIAEERVDERDRRRRRRPPPRARTTATSVTFGVSFGIIGRRVTLRTALTTSIGAGRGCSRTDAAFLDVRARDVQLDRARRPRRPTESRATSTYSSSVVPQMLTNTVAPARAQLRQLLGDEAVHADALQADGVQHAGRRLDDARRRMAFALGEEQALDARRRRATRDRRRRAYSTP